MKNFHEFKGKVWNMKRPSALQCANLTYIADPLKYIIFLELLQQEN